MAYVICGQAITVTDFGEVMNSERSAAHGFEYDPPDPRAGRDCRVTLKLRGHARTYWTTISCGVAPTYLRIVKPEREIASCPNAVRLEGWNLEGKELNHNIATSCEWSASLGGTGRCFPIVAC